MTAGNIYNFYADSEDVLGVWKFISVLPGIRFVERFSRKNLENRWFERFPEEEYRSDAFVTLAAWPSEVGGAPRQRIHRLPEGSARKLRASGTCVLESPAFIEMTTAPSPNEKYISPRRLRYWTEKTARKFGKIDFAECQVDEVDWPELKRITDQIISHIKRAAIARWNSKPVLPGCVADLNAGSRKLWFWGKEGWI